MHIFRWTSSVCCQILGGHSVWSDRQTRAILCFRGCNCQSLEEECCHFCAILSGDGTEMAFVVGPVKIGFSYRGGKWQTERESKEKERAKEGETSVCSVVWHVCQPEARLLIPLACVNDVDLRKDCLETSLILNPQIWNIDFCCVSQHYFLFLSLSMSLLFSLLLYSLSLSLALSRSSLLSLSCIILSYTVSFSVLIIAQRKECLFLCPLHCPSFHRIPFMSEDRGRQATQATTSFDNFWSLKYLTKK